jgi:hypothetical protein
MLEAQRAQHSMLDTRLSRLENDRITLQILLVKVDASPAFHVAEVLDAHAHRLVMIGQSPQTEGCVYMILDDIYLPNLDFAR